MTPQPDQTDKRTAPAVTLTPHGSAWSSLITRHAAARPPQAAAFRAELGLPTDKPVVMSGHQAQWWHAGILAKQIALAAVCTQVNGGGAGAWIVVDQDASDSLRLLYPSRPSQASSTALPSRGHWQIGPEASAAQLRADAAIADLPAFSPSQPPTDVATPDAARALRAIADSAARWAHASSAAEQIARANAELCTTLLAPGEAGAPTLLFATRLSRTTAMRGLLEQMAADPAACVTAYNRAAAEAAGSGIAPLSHNPEKGRFELPLWQLSGTGRPAPRRRVFAHTLGDAPLDTLAPRGLMMTALLRWLGCDLFIHGQGGGATGKEGGYDKVTERWFKLWLNVDLAPSVVATATILLPFNDSVKLLTEEDLRGAYRSRHEARHAPRTLNDATAQQEKDRLVAAIAASPPADRAERHRLYRDLQSHLERYRAAHAADLSTLATAAEATAAELDRQSVLRERTWPWPLIPRPLLLRLQRTVAAQLKG